MFVNSSPPSINTLHKSNELLVSTLLDRTTLLSLVRGSIEKIASGNKRLHTKIQSSNVIQIIYAL